MVVDATELRFGPYRAPRFKLGQKIIDLSRGEVTIVAISDGRIGPWSVQKWRRTLGVKDTPGNAKLRKLHTTPEKLTMLGRAASAVARDPERRRKISAAKLGVPRPRKVMEVLRRANLGRKLSAEHRRKLSIAQKKRGTIPPAAGVPWSKAEERLLRTLTVADVARRTGQTVVAVRIRRRKLGYSAGRKRARARIKSGRSM